MRGSLVPILMTISGAVMYHVSSKSVPRDAHPMAAIIAAYVAAIAACAATAVLWPALHPSSPSLRHLHWSVVGIGLGAALIEVGFLLAYRAGWPLNAASLFVNVAAALVLIPVGFALFSEHLSAARGLGIVLCVAGLVLLTRE